MANLPVIGYYRYAGRTRSSVNVLNEKCDAMIDYVETLGKSIKIYGDDGLSQASKENTELFASLGAMKENQMMIIDRIESVKPTNFIKLFQMVREKKLLILFFKQSIGYPQDSLEETIEKAFLFVQVKATLKTYKTRKTRVKKAPNPVRVIGKKRRRPAPVSFTTYRRKMTIRD